MKKVLTIAGSDSSGGAGIQADLKTMLANGVYGMSVVTAITAQNTLGVMGVQEVTPKILAAQLDAVFTDISPDAVKIGMVPSAAAVTVIADKLKKYAAKNIVIDPVMVATSGANLVLGKAVAQMRAELFPLGTVITPNIPELALLSDMAISTEDDMAGAAISLQKEIGTSVLAKGGHLHHTADDVLVYAGGLRWYRGKRIKNNNTHGTGCTLSSAIAANLAKGLPLLDAVNKAKSYLTAAIAAKLDLGRGHGPLDHGFALHGPFASKS